MVHCIVISGFHCILGIYLSSYIRGQRLFQSKREDWSILPSCCVKTIVQFVCYFIVSTFCKLFLQSFTFLFSIRDLGFAVASGDSRLGGSYYVDREMLVVSTYGLVLVAARSWCEVNNGYLDSHLKNVSSVLTVRKCCEYSA